MQLKSLYLSRFSADHYGLHEVLLLQAFCGKLLCGPSLEALVRVTSPCLIIVERAIAAISFPAAAVIKAEKSGGSAPRQGLLVRAQAEGVEPEIARQVRSIALQVLRPLVSCTSGP